MVTTGSLDASALAARFIELWEELNLESEK